MPSPHLRNTFSLQFAERMTNRPSKNVSGNNPCPHNTPFFPFSLSLNGISRHGHETPEWHCNVKSDLPSPEFHMGLTSDRENDSTVWFVTTFYQPYLLSKAVTVHFGLISIGSILLPLFFLRSSNDKEELLLETSLNPYQHDLQGLQLLRCLCSQASYRIHYRNLAAKTEYALEVPNTHQSLYRQAVQLIETHSPWTTAQFVQAQYHLVQLWSTPEERYQNLRHPPRHTSSLDL